ncbi:MAG: glycosyltransferase [Selenomonadaceae bacterium]|nr:glycosyltransferase [Selenomonadaceae bacterium]
MIKVSIIIPVYNTEKYIAECLESVISQELKDFEILCIDDASTDNSPEIMRKYTEKDKRIRIITLQKNGGQAAGRNLGMKNAEGEYVYFLDSDDMLQEGALQSMCSLIDQYQVDGMVFNAEDFYESSELEKEAPILPGVTSAMESRGVIDGESMFLAMGEEGRPCCQPGRFLWKRSYLSENNIINDAETSPHEDELFFLKAVLSAKRMVAATNVFHLRRYRADSVMTGRTFLHDLRHCQSYLLLWLRSAEFLREHDFLNGDCARVAYDYIGMFLKGGLYYAKRFTSEQRAKLRFNNLLDACILETLLAECAPNRRAEVFLKEDDLEQVLKKDRVFLYGAGICGQKLLQLLLQCGYPREKIFFAVTDRQGKTSVEGFPVFNFKDIDDFDNQKDMFVVAVTKKWQGEIASMLKTKKYSYVAPDYGYAVMAAPSDEGK